MSELDKLEFRILEEWAKNRGYAPEDAPPYVRKYAREAAALIGQDRREWFHDSDRYGALEYETSIPGVWFKVNAYNDHGGAATYREWPTYEEAMAHRELLWSGQSPEEPDPKRYTTWEILGFKNYVKSYVMEEG